jgi:hypothetical protein
MKMVSHISGRNRVGSSTGIIVDQRSLTCHGPERVTIGSLSDDVLLEIFHFCRTSTDPQVWHMNWHKLVHVCQRWRFVVLGSPLGLDLQIFCTPKAPVKKLLNVWPVLPLHIYFFPTSTYFKPEDNLDNLIATLEHPDRVCEIDISCPPHHLWDQILAVMQVSFPALTHLSLGISMDKVLHLPGTLLNGSAPCLKHLHFSGVSFPSLPRLLLSATNLITLYLYPIPNNGYIPPEVMATSLTTLTRLEYLTIVFESPTPHLQPTDRRLPQPTPSVLPALIQFRFDGVSDYLEVLTGRIDAPRLDNFMIRFLNHLVIVIPQTIRFLTHREWVRKPTPYMVFNPSFYVSISFRPYSPQSRPTVRWNIKCEGLDLQVFSAVQICRQIKHLTSGMEILDIGHNKMWYTCVPAGLRPDDIDPTLWRDIFRSFSSVRTLRISAELEPFIAAALQRLTASGSSAPDVFPLLESLSIDELTPDYATKKGIESFVTARQHSGHPVTVHRTESQTKNWYGQRAICP